MLGVVYAPVLAVMYCAAEGKAWKEEGGHKIRIQVQDARPPLVVVSRSHADSELEDYLKHLGDHQTTAIGSSLKFRLVAEGKAQLYPRFGPTNIWDMGQATRWRWRRVRTLMTGRVNPLTMRRASHSLIRGSAFPSFDLASWH